MTELRYNKTRLFLLLLIAVPLTLGTSWLAIHHPVPDPGEGGRYAALYDLLGPAGIELLFGAGTLLFAAGCALFAGILLSDGVAARITADGLQLRRGFRQVALPWHDILAVEEHTRHAGRRTFHILHVRHRPIPTRRAGKDKTALSLDHLRATPDQIGEWIDAAAAEHARATRPQPASSPPGFGRRQAILNSRLELRTKSSALAEK